MFFQLIQKLNTLNYLKTYATTKIIIWEFDNSLKEEEIYLRSLPNYRAVHAYIHIDNKAQNFNNSRTKKTILDKNYQRTRQVSNWETLNTEIQETH